MVQKGNPWALSEITSRMIEAYKRDIWHASDSMKEKLEEEYMEIEGENE
jgi:Cobalamin biosynthesis protein CobN and related Mg-chelatases